MIYDEFVDKLSQLDDSNCFVKSEVKNNPYNKFYDLYDPRGVEFEYNSCNIFMIPYEKISIVTKEYDIIKADYVFAISDGDPYFVKNKKVYTCCHGTKNPDLEFVANSFEDFMRNIVKGEC
jgi:hypothetical protein